jgi:uncharacterized protein (DUF58 family)
MTRGVVRMKLSKEILQKVRNIEIHTRRLLSGTLIGDYSSAKKGSGLEFDQIRDYQEGDDVRFIDWKGTARQDKLLVREYIEERNRVIMLVVDGSASTFFSSSEELKSELFAQIASVLALVADYGKDQVGLILFSDQVQTVIPPKSGRQHTRLIMETLFNHVPEGTTSFEPALHRLIQMNRKDAIVFLLSDFIVGPGYEKLLRIVCKKYDTVAIRCFDQSEQALPDVGFLSVRDPETGDCGLLKTGSKGLLVHMKEWHKEVGFTLKKCGADLMDLEVQKPFMGELVRFCRQRMFS